MAYTREQLLKDNREAFAAHGYRPQCPDYRAITMANHRRYFAQLVRPGHKTAVLLWISLEKLQKAEDPINLSDWPCRDFWDNMSGGILYRDELEAIGHGSGLSQSDRVCIYKEAARQLVEEANS